MVQSRKKGFTLIELIIGITILALLAVGLLAALDPAEQFAKARDTSTRNTLLEIFGAMQRYEASQETYPEAVADLADSAGAAIRTTVSGTSTYNFVGTVSGIEAVDALVTAGELKGNFKNAAGTTLDKIWIYKDAGADPLVNGDGKLMLCFQSTSKSFSLAAGQYTLAAAPTSGDLGAVAPSQTGACATAGTDLSAREVCVYCAQ